MFADLDELLKNVHDEESIVEVIDALELISQVTVCQRRRQPHLPTIRSLGLGNCKERTYHSTRFAPAGIFPKSFSVMTEVLGHEGRAPEGGRIQ